MSDNPSGTGGGGGRNQFTPREELVEALTNLGISRNAATRALFLTGNYSADLAAAYIFENPDENVDIPFSTEMIGSEHTLSLSDEDDEVEEFDAEYKMVLVVNSELSMGVGKIAAQTAHAALGLYRLLIQEQQHCGEMLLNWEQFGETKIVLKGHSTAHLQELFKKATDLHLVAYSVQDAGKTQIAPGSLTVLAIMGKVETVNQVTRQLTLL